jgi:hypothetical protein
MKTSNNEPDIAIHTFATSDEAWTFMHQCDERGEFAGYPSLTAPYTVKVLIGQICGTVLS